jgi:hypothetical protein
MVKDTILTLSQKCGEWPYSFTTFVANRKILLDTADLVVPSMTKNMAHRNLP